MENSVYTPNVRPLEPRPISQKKKCRLCGVEKPLYDYKEDRRMPDGKWHTCSACLADKDRASAEERLETFVEPTLAPGAEPGVTDYSVGFGGSPSGEPVDRDADDYDPSDPQPDDVNDHGAGWAAEPEPIPAEEVAPELPEGWRPTSVSVFKMGAETVTGYAPGANKSVLMLGSPPPPSHDQEHIAALQAKITRLYKAERKIRRELSYARLELENCELRVRLAVLERGSKEAQP